LDKVAQPIGHLIPKKLSQRVILPRSHQISPTGWDVLDMLLVFLKALLSKAFKNTNNTFETLPNRLCIKFYRTVVDNMEICPP
jgi:hypothetical protein